MLITLPVRFEAKGLKTGSADPKTYKLWEEVDFDVPLVDPADAPVGISWNATPPDAAMLPRGNGRSHPWAECPEDGRHLTVWHNGQHWERLTASDNAEDWSSGRVGNVPLQIDHLGSRLSEGGDAPLLKVTGFDRRARSSVLRHGNDPHGLFERLEFSQRNAAVRRMRRSVDDLIVVGGDLYRRLPAHMRQPTLAVVTWSREAGDTPAFLVVRTKASVGGFEPIGLNQYPLSDFDTAYEAATQYNEGKPGGAQADAYNASMRPEVHDVVYSSDLREDITRAREHHDRFFRGLMDVTFGQIPPWTLRQVVQLQEAVTLARTQEDLDRTLELASKLLSALSSSGHPQYFLAGRLGDLVSTLEARTVSSASLLKGFIR